MAALPCEWPSCDGRAGVAVQLGDSPEVFRLHGRFCVPHAAIRADELRRSGVGTVWYDWIRPPRLRLLREEVPDVAPGTEEEATG